MARPWREADHPRDPESGEFVEKTGWAGRVVTVMFGGHRKASGRDIRTKLDYDELVSKVAGFSDQQIWSGPDRALAEIVAQQGFDGPPEVLTKSEMDERIAASWPEMWRGVRSYSIEDPDPDKASMGEATNYSSRQVAEQFRTGPYFAGQGVFGNGTYASREMEEALGYADMYGGGLLRIALNPSARVVDFDELLKLGEKHKGAHWATGLMIRGFKTTGVGSPERAAYDQTKTRLANKSKVLADLGRLATAMGYDAIAVQPRNASLRDGRVMYYVILNRTAVAVQSDPLV